MAAPARITIVTPSFNQGWCLEETIRSIHDQGYPDVEHIIVDGGSTDESVEVIKRHERLLAWWVSEKDGGQAHALNKGFARATGVIRAYLNSDDLLEPGSLARVAELFADGAAWVASPVRCFEAGKADWMYPAKRGATINDWLSWCPAPQQGCFWSAAAHEKAGAFREDLRYVFDYEFWLRLLLRAGVQPTVIDQPLGAFRYHGASKTVGQMGAFEREERAVRREYRGLLPPGRRAGAWCAERRTLGWRRQVRALERAERGERGAALRDVASSVVFWPPMAVQRRTIGALRRAIRAGGATAAIAQSTEGEQPGRRVERPVGVGVGGDGP